MRENFEYMGKHVAIAMTEAGDQATITIDGRDFTIERNDVGEPEDNYIKLWMCPDVYTMTLTPEEMAQYIITYWHQHS